MVSVLFIPLDGPPFRESVPAYLPPVYDLAEQVPDERSPFTAAAMAVVPGSTPMRIRRFVRHRVGGPVLGWWEYREVHP
jgi:hypothetical protein